MAEPQPSKRRSWLWPGIAVVLIAGLGAIVYEWRSFAPWGTQHLGSWVASLDPWMERHAGTLMRPATRSAAAPSEADPVRGQAAATVPVSATEARTGSFPVVLTGLGTVEPYNSVLVRSRVDGQIVKLNFKEGDLVEQGDILVQIDQRPYQAALEQAQAKKQQDEANLANAKRDLERYTSLAKSDYATRQQLDTQTSQVAQLTAQIAADQALVDNAQTQFDYTTIRAPIKGRVGFRLVDLGNIVNASSTTGIVQINQIKPISVIFTQPEELLPQVSAGLAKGPLPVTALSTDGSQVYSEGQLEVFNNEVDAASGTIRLKAVFRNADKKLWPGLSVTTRMTVSTRDNVVIIPTTAVLRGQNGFYAYVVGTDKKVDARNLKITLMNASDAVVDDGIKSGETVVTTGQYRLRAGTVVEAKMVTPDKTALAEQ